MNHAEWLADAAVSVVHVGQCAGDLGRDERANLDGYRLGDQDRTLGEFGECASGDVLHRDEVSTSVLRDIDHIHDVGVVHEPRDACLVEEHGHDLGISLPPRL